MKNQRVLKVKQTGDFYKQTDTPEIKLKGKWLEDAGFKNCNASVEVKEGEIIIRRMA